MKGFQHFECPHLALLKSAASFVLSGAIDSEHSIMQGIDKYANAFMQGQAIDRPKYTKYQNKDTDPEIAAYLAQLYHRKTHANIANNKKVEADLNKQLQDFTYGNPLWQQMFIEYFKYYWQYPFHKGQLPYYRSWQDPKYGKSDIKYGLIDWRLPAKSRIAIIGDIGTGTDIAAAVIISALKFKPDAFIHLGDVYYSGTYFEFAHRFTGLFESVFHAAKYKAPVFGIPGNHEYFTGAIPYFANLDSNKLMLHHSQMQRASYFCLRTNDDAWQFLGMDTGYHGHYMDVPKSAQDMALKELHLDQINSNNPYFYKVMDPTTEPEFVYLRDDELEWHLDKIEKFPGRTFLHSHHQLYSAKQTLCQTNKQTTKWPWINTKLWQQLGSTFEKHIAAWIWGHEHNLCIFQDSYLPQGWPNNQKALLHGRCAGHAAIPVAENEQPYQTMWPVPLINSKVKLDLTNGWYNRGFQIIETQGKSKPAIIRYYQIAGANPEPLLIFEEKIY